MTAEQADAFAQLRTLAAPGRLRVRPDAEGWPVIPARLGQIEFHDGRDLAVFTDRPRLHAKLWAIPGVRRPVPHRESCGSPGGDAAARGHSSGHSRARRG